MRFLSFYLNAHSSRIYRITLGSIEELKALKDANNGRFRFSEYNTIFLTKVINMVKYDNTNFNEK
jgi:hypothetical protein